MCMGVRVCMRVHVFMCACLYVYMCVFVCVHMLVCVCLYVCMYMCLRMHFCMCACRKLTLLSSAALYFIFLRRDHETWNVTTMLGEVGWPVSCSDLLLLPRAGTAGMCQCTASICRHWGAKLRFSLCSLYTVLRLN